MNDQDTANGWAQIEGLRPRLHAHAKTTAHVFRKQRWYVLADGATGRHLRFNEKAYEFIGRLDGDRSIAEIYHDIANQLGEGAPTRAEILRLLTQLYTSGALQSNMAPDVEELFKRYQAEQRMNRVRRWLNPLALRFPLFDPDNLLNRYTPLVRPLFSTGGVLIWFVVIMLGLITVLFSLAEISQELSSKIISPTNIVTMIVIFPLLKTLHEFAHAFAVKIWGGEVHEMGITLLVLMPVPYVDASAAWAFQEKYKRVLVGAAGMSVELFIASLAIMTWAIVEPGVLRDTALAAFFIGGVSTLFFNGNPLLRFDGYYILQDLIEIPNLYARSSQYNMYLLKKNLLGINTAQSPVTAENEEYWFFAYGILAWIYRMAIMLSIAIFLAGKFFIIGILLALWSLVLMIVLPLYRGTKFLLTSPEIASNRQRAFLGAGLASGTIIAVVTLVPFSLHSNSQGIVWVPDQAHLYAKSDGFVTDINAVTGESVASGEPLIQLDNPNLAAQLAVQQAKMQELIIRQQGQRFNDPVAAEQTGEELEAIKAELAATEKDIASLSLHSNVAGQFVIDEQRKLLGSYVSKGEAVGYIVNPEQLIVRLVVPQTTIGLVRREMKDISVRLAERPATKLTATLLRQTPSGDTRLPNRALGAAGGGLIPVTAEDPTGTTATEAVFQIDLKLDDKLQVAGIGSRAYVRFNHGRESLMSRWLRSLQQLLLRHLSF